jgi:hypothetical protein
MRDIGMVRSEDTQFAFWFRTQCALMAWLWRALFALLFLLCPAVLAAQTCQVPPDLMSVARTLAALPVDRGEIPAALSARLAEQMDTLSEADILKTLSDTELSSLSTTAVDLLAEAERLSRGGGIYNPTRITNLLAELEDESILACADTGKSIFQNLQSGREGGFLTEDGGFSWSEIEKRAEEEKLFAAGAVVAAMAGFISVLVLLDAGFRWIMALLYNRKACRIPSELRVRDHLIEGLVITLGRGGCRFHPLNMVEFDEALADLRGSPASLTIEGGEMAVRCSGIYDTVTDFRFEKPLTLKQQRGLLAHSTISPYYIRRSRDGGEMATKHLTS